MENKDLPSIPSKPHRVIQPVSDMSDYKPKEPAEPTGPAAQPAPSHPAERPIYPDAKRDAQTEPTHPVPHTNETKSYLSNDSAASRVPLLRVYAIVNIVYALYLAYRIVSGVGGSSLAAPSILQGLLLGSTAFHVIIGVYLLKARELRVVSGLLLGLIITDGLTVLNMLVSYAQTIKYIHMGIVWPFLITLVLLILAWYARTRVDLVSLED